MAHRALRNCETGVQWREHKLSYWARGGRELREEGKGEREREKELT